MQRAKALVSQCIHWMADVSVSQLRHLVLQRVHWTELIEYVKERKQFGRSIAQFQNTQFQLAEMATKVEAAQLLVYKAANGKRDSEGIQRRSC